MDAVDLHDQQGFSAPCTAPVCSVAAAFAPTGHVSMASCFRAGVALAWLTTLALPKSSSISKVLLQTAVQFLQPMQVNSSTKT